MKNAALSGKPYAGNPYVRFDEREFASLKPGGPLLYNRLEGLSFRHWLAALFLLSCPVAARAGADVTVPFGEELTLESGDYGLIVVNGRMTVADNAVVTCSQIKIGVVGEDNPADNQAVYVQGAGSTVQVNGTMAGNIGFGCGTRASITLNDGAMMDGTGPDGTKVTGCLIGADTAAGATTPIEIFLNNATLTTVGADVKATSGGKSNADIARIHLTGAKTRFLPKHFSLPTANGSVRFLFEGGELVGTEWWKQGSLGFLRSGVNSGGAVIRLESVEGNPIRIRCNGGDCQAAVFMPCKKPYWGSGSGDSGFETLGSGAFVLSGSSNIPLVLNPAECASLVDFNHTGGFRIASGAALKLDQGGVTTLAKMTSGALSLPVGGTLDLNGCDLTVGSFDSAGTITDSTGATPTLTFGANGADSTFSAPPAGGIKLVKQGAGRLILPEGPLEDVKVEAGMVDLCDRAAVGFPYWRFKVMNPPQDKTVRICEFAASNGTEDVRADLTAVSYTTAGDYHYGSPSNLFDGVVMTTWDDRAFLSESTGDISNRVFFVMHFGGAPQITFNDFSSSAYREARYVKFEAFACAHAVPAVNGKIDRYAFYTADNGWFKRISPETFRLQGSVTGNDWRDMDIVSNYTGVSTSGHVWSKLFEVPSYGTYGKSPVAVGTLELADGAEWTIDLRQAQISVGTLKAGRNVTVRLVNCGSRKAVKALPVAIGSCVNPENVAGWQVSFDGETDSRRRLFFDNGTLGVTRPGLVLILCGTGNAAPSKPTTIHFAGDSTLDYHAGDESRYGSWGWNLRHWKKSTTELDVRAKSGYSTPSFRSANYWGALLDAVHSGDWVIVQFGHNDQGIDRAGFNATVEEYTANLKTMIGEVRAKGGHPLICTPIVRRTQDADGNLVENPDANGKKLSDYAAAALAAAADEGCPAVDMNALTTAEVLSVGVDVAAKYYVYADRSHPNPEGARRFAELFLGDVKSRGLAIASLFDYQP